MAVSSGSSADPFPASRSRETVRPLLDRRDRGRACGGRQQERRHHGERKEDAQPHASMVRGRGHRAVTARASCPAGALRRYAGPVDPPSRYAVAIICLAAQVVALGLPTVALPLGDLGQPLGTVAAPIAARAHATERTDRPSSVVCARLLTPRAPPLA